MSVDPFEAGLSDVGRVFGITEPACKETPQLSVSRNELLTDFVDVQTVSEDAAHELAHGCRRLIENCSHYRYRRSTVNRKRMMDLCLCGTGSRVGNFTRTTGRNSDYARVGKPARH
jgi:hypothetical protein